MLEMSMQERAGTDQNNKMTLRYSLMILIFSGFR